MIFSKVKMNITMSLSLLLIMSIIHQDLHLMSVKTGAIMMHLLSCSSMTSTRSLMLSLLPHLSLQNRHFLFHKTHAILHPDLLMILIVLRSIISLLNLDNLHSFRSLLLMKHCATSSPLIVLSHSTAPAKYVFVHHLSPTCSKRSHQIKSPDLRLLIHLLLPLHWSQAALMFCATGRPCPNLKCSLNLVPIL